MDWTQLNVATLSQSGARLLGRSAPPDGIDASRFSRLMEESVIPNGLTGVEWVAQFERRTPSDGSVQHWLHLTVSAALWLTCQRCMEPVLQRLSSDRWFRFVNDEETAWSEDDDADEDLLVLEPKLDLLTLVEDELILSLPLVPMHEVCPEPVVLSVVDPGFEQALSEREHPFAALASVGLRAAKVAED